MGVARYRMITDGTYHSRDGRVRIERVVNPEYLRSKTVHIRRVGWLVTIDGVTLPKASITKAAAYVRADAHLSRLTP